MGHLFFSGRGIFLLAAGICTGTALGGDLVLYKTSDTLLSGSAWPSLFTGGAPASLEAMIVRNARPAPASFEPNDPLYPDQWHLTMTNVQGAWSQGYSGAGVTIGIVDDGVEVSHPDLNVSATSSYNFIENHSDPSPTSSGQDHGTAVAGVAGAIGDNGIGVIGAAYQAQIAGLKVGFGSAGTHQQFIDATLHQSSNPDPAQNTIRVKNHSYGVQNPYIDSQGMRDQISALDQSVSAGTIHVFAAGNEVADTNWKRLQSADNAIVVSATADDGMLAWYSNVGSSVTVTAPSSGGSAGITTTDLSGTYRSDFGGTSAAAPLVAGILSMGIEANPQMDVRLAKHLMAMTSVKIDDTEEGFWIQNSAGINFSPFYGFGMVDAGAFTSAAQTYTGVTARTSLTVSWDTALDGGVEIEDRPPDEEWIWGEVLGASIPSGFLTDPLEEVVLTVSIAATEGHRWTPTEMFIAVVDPHGNQLPVAFYSTGAATVDGIEEWKFTVNGFWGQDPAGEWLVGVADGVHNDQTGTLTGLSMTLHTGSVIPEPATVLMLLFAGGAVYWVRRRFPAR